MNILKIVSIKYPYQLDDGTIHYVAVDFMQMRNRDYTAFRYYCPDYRKNAASSRKPYPDIFQVLQREPHRERRHAEQSPQGSR